MGYGLAQHVVELESVATKMDPHLSVQFMFVFVPGRPRDWLNGAPGDDRKAPFWAGNSHRTKKLTFELPVKSTTGRGREMVVGSSLLLIIR